jgi:hypothetical protein
LETRAQPRRPPNSFDGDDEMDLVSGRVTPCAPLMRALRGVMLNGLCQGVRDMSVQLDDTIAHTARWPPLFEPVKSDIVLNIGAVLCG